MAAVSAGGDAAAGAPPLKPATSSRDDNLLYELKHMAAFDLTPFQKGQQQGLRDYTRDTVQMLVNKVFGLPRQDTDCGPAVQLPKEEIFKLPRSKPVPKVKQKTRWEKFMEERDMRKRKRSSLVWDETSGDWKRRWGKDSAKKNEEKAANWVHEVREGEDPLANPFEKKALEKQLLKARQKMREVRNKVEAAGGRLKAAVPDLVDVKNNKRGKEGLKEALKRAQVSSASHGKFDRLAANEATNLQPKVRRNAMPHSLGEEKERYLKATNRVLSGESVIDKDKAAKISAGQVHVEEAAVRAREKTGGSKRRSKQGKFGSGKRR